MMVDVIIVGLFLAITMAIGIYYGRGITSFQDYAVGRKKTSTTVIITSLLATLYGGRYLHFSLGNFYRLGFHSFLKQFIISFFTIYIFSRLIIPRMQEFIGHLSIAESMGKLYGLTARFITGILGMIRSIVMLAIHINMALKITAILFPKIDPNSSYLVILLTLLIIIYSTFGGIRAVATTDVYQFFVFGVCFPIVIFVLLYYAKNPIVGWQHFTDIPQFDTRNIAIAKTIKSLLHEYMYVSLAMITPAYIQRFYMASSLPQAVKVFNRTAFIAPIVPLLILSVVIALHIGGHSIESYDVLSYIANLSHFPGIRGMLVTAIIALTMSASDSCLHVASVLFIGDIWPIAIRLTKRIHIPSLTLVRIPSLTLVRITSIVIGMISLLCQLQIDNVQSMLRCLYIYDPVVGVPFIMACLGFRSRPLTFLVTMAIHVLVSIYLIGYKGEIISKNTIIISIIANILALLIIHYLLPKRPNTGWINIEDTSIWDLKNQITKRRWSACLQRLKSFFTRTYWESVFPKQERTFIMSGIYFVVHASIALFFIQKIYLMPYIYLYISVMAIGTIVAIYPGWHSYIKKGNALLHGLWPILLFVLLFMVPLQFAKLGHYGPMVCALCIANLGLAVILLSFKVSIMLIGMAFLLQKVIPPYIPFWSFFAKGFSTLSIELLLAMILISAVIVGFGMYKYLRNQSLAKLNISTLTQAYEHRISLEAIYNQGHWARLHAVDSSNLLYTMADQLKETCYNLYAHHPHKLKNEIDLFTKKLYKLGDSMLWRAKEERSIKLDTDTVQWTAIEPVILKVNQHILDLGNPLALLLRKQTKINEILIDPSLFECFLLLNLLQISKTKQAMYHMVVLTIADTTLQYNAPTDQAALNLPALAFWFSTDTTMKKTQVAYAITETTTSILPATEEHFYQIESRQIVEAHGGHTQITETAESLSCLYVLPVQGKKVMRFKTYSPTDLVAGTVSETAESLAQEKDLINTLSEKNILHKKTIEKTIAFVKNAHGLVTRKSGVPYYTHPMEVAKILLEVTQDPDTILAGLLHDIVEDTPITLNQIEVIYGQKVAAIVDKVTEYNTNGYPWKLDKAEQKGILYSCNDVHVVQVKLADRLHNLRTLYARKREDQQRISRETLSFYIPWGKRNKGPEAWLMEMQRIGEEVLSNPC